MIGKTEYCTGSRTSGSLTRDQPDTSGQQTQDYPEFNPQETSGVQTRGPPVMEVTGEIKHQIQVSVNPIPVGGKIFSSTKSFYLIGNETVCRCLKSLPLRFGLTKLFLETMLNKQHHRNEPHPPLPITLSDNQSWLNKTFWLPFFFVNFAGGGRGDSSRIHTSTSLTNVYKVRRFKKNFDFFLLIFQLFPFFLTSAQEKRVDLILSLKVNIKKL